MPFVAALGVVLVTVATIAKLFLLIPVGVLISVAALVVWLWPDRKELELMRTSTLPAETGLPIFTTGTQSLGWLGLLFLMAVLGWCVGTLLYTYFYLRLYSTEWPQGNLPMPEPVPSGTGVQFHCLCCSGRLLCGLAGIPQRGREAVSLIGLAAALLPAGCCLSLAHAAAERDYGFRRRPMLTALSFIC